MKLFFSVAIKLKTSLCLVYSDKSGETVTVMLNTGTNVNVCDNKNKSTPLHLAANQGNDAGVKALLSSRHCDVNCQVSCF